MVQEPDPYDHALDHGGVALNYETISERRVLAEDDRAELAAMTAAYQTAIRARDHATIAALYADDAVIHPANRPSGRGRDALDAFFEATDSEPQDMTFSTVDLVIAESGDLAYEVGTSSGPGWMGKYLTVYRRTPPAGASQGRSAWISI